MSKMHHGGDFMHWTPDETECKSRLASRDDAAVPPRILPLHRIKSPMPATPDPAFVADKETPSCQIVFMELVRERSPIATGPVVDGPYSSRQSPCSRCCRSRLWRKRRGAATGRPTGATARRF